MPHHRSAHRQRAQNVLMTLVCGFLLTACVSWSGPGAGLGFMPAWSQSPVAAQQSTSVAQGVVVSAPAATFIVRFNNEPELEQVCRNFRRDEAGTRAAYSAWAAQHDQLKGLQLVRASYSGELILALPASDRSGRTARDVIAALKTIDNLAYAEIDSMASASDGG